jgi:organic radical activating enzyme
MQLAIERVLPKPIRQPILLKRYEAQKTLPAGEEIIAEIRKLGGNPPPGLTRLESFQLLSNLSSPATDNQIAYIRRLGGNPPPTINLQEASDLIQELLHSVKATEKQIDFIRSLGGNPPRGLSRAGADELIPRLKAEQREKQARENLPTPRQTMVLRFWNRTDLVNASQWDVEQWLNQFYNEDPRRKEAWEVFKKENHDDGSQRDPSWVPIGVGGSYLLRVSDSQSATVRNARFAG